MTLELVWSYHAPRFFSTNISGAQRLANGNTLVTEGAGGRVFEVTTDGTIVWEYMNPLFAGATRRTTSTARIGCRTTGYRSSAPSEQRVTPPALGEFRSVA